MTRNEHHEQKTAEQDQGINRNNDTTHSSDDSTTASTADKPLSAIDENGNINWDCPCLAGALQPPCGEAFKAAFSCFVYSKTEPKGMDCEAAFAAMKQCFQDHPEIYMKDGEEGDEEDSDSQEEKENNTQSISESGDK